jgi:hypothetical protein
MAKKKLNENQDQELCGVDVDNVVSNDVVVDGGVDADTIPTHQVSEDTPEFVRTILKIFRNYPNLVVDAQGGAYIPGPQLKPTKGAILYTNPYYNN